MAAILRGGAAAYGRLMPSPARGNNIIERFGGWRGKKMRGSRVVIRVRVEEEEEEVALAECEEVGDEGAERGDAGEKRGEAKRGRGGGRAAATVQYVEL